MTLAAILTELLRLYDWRFTLAEREKDQRNTSEKDFRVETRRLLNQYGAEKKAAWEAARAVLSSPSVQQATPPQEQRPRIGVAVIVRDDAGRTLLGKRAKEPNRGKWVIPGGGIRWDEPWQDAGRREVLEETGLHVEITDAVSVGEIIGDGEHRVILFASGRAVGGAVRGGDDLQEPAFFSPAEIAGMDLSWITQRMLVVSAVPVLGEKAAQKAGEETAALKEGAGLTLGGVWIGEVQPTAETLAAAAQQPGTAPAPCGCDSVGYGWPHKPGCPSPALPKEEVAPDEECVCRSNRWCPVHSPAPAPQPLEEQLSKEGSAAAPAPGDAGRVELDSLLGDWFRAIGDSDYTAAREEIHRFVARVRSEERERCARLCDAYQSEAECHETASHIADLIRASDATSAGGGE